MMNTQQTLNITDTLEHILTDDQIIAVLNQNKSALSNVYHPFIQNECAVFEEEVQSTLNGIQHVRQLIQIKRHIALMDIIYAGQSNEDTAVAHACCDFFVWADVMRDEETNHISSIALDSELLMDVDVLSPKFTVNGEITKNIAILELIDKLLLNIDHKEIIQDLLQKRLVDVQKYPHVYLVQAIGKIDGRIFVDFYKVYSPIELSTESQILYKSIAYCGLYGVCQDFSDQFDFKLDQYTKSFDQLHLAWSTMIDFDNGISIVRLIVDDWNSAAINQDELIMHHSLMIDSDCFPHAIEVQKNFSDNMPNKNVYG